MWTRLIIILQILERVYVSDLYRVTRLALPGGCTHVVNVAICGRGTGRLPIV